MLTIQKAGNSTSYRVNSVECKNVDNNPRRCSITVKTPDTTIELYAWTDSNTTAEKAAERIRQSVDKDIIISLYAERDYLFLIDGTLSEDDREHQLKVSGRIESNI